MLKDMRTLVLGSPCGALVGGALLLASLGCTDSHSATEAGCDLWREAAFAYSERCGGPVVPPVEDPEDVRCVSDSERAAAGLVPLSECAAMMHAAGLCGDIRAIVGPCTRDAVASWEPAFPNDACARYLAAADSLGRCDPVVWTVANLDSTCVDDATLALRTGGQMNSVAECADYAMARAYPCEIAIGAGRTLCGTDQVLVD